MRPNIEDFTLSNKYQVQFDQDTSCEFELIEIIPYKKAEQPGPVSFSLLFRGDVNEKIYAQGTYEVYDKKNVSRNLFLIPRQPDEEGIYYEIIIQ